MIQSPGTPLPKVCAGRRHGVWRFWSVKTSWPWPWDALRCAMRLDELLCIYHLEPHRTHWGRNWRYENPLKPVKKPIRIQEERFMWSARVMLESLLCKKFAQAGELGEPSLLREQAMVARLCNINLLRSFKLPHDQFSGANLVFELHSIMMNNKDD